MKKISKVLLLFILCLTFIGCSKETETTATKLEQAGYTTSIDKETGSVLIENEDGTIRYFPDEKTMNFTNNGTNSDLITGNIHGYSEENMSEEVKKYVEDKLDSVGLTLESVVDHAKNYHKENK